MSKVQIWDPTKMSNLENKQNPPDYQFIQAPNLECWITNAPVIVLGRINLLHPNISAMLKDFDEETKKSRTFDLKLPDCNYYMNTLAHIGGQESIDTLEAWQKADRMYYSGEALLNASFHNHVDVLEWFKERGGLKQKLVDSITISIRWTPRVFMWWQNSGFRIKVGV